MKRYFLLTLALLTCTFNAANWTQQASQKLLQDLKQEADALLKFTRDVNAKKLEHARQQEQDKAQLEQAKTQHQAATTELTLAQQQLKQQELKLATLQTALENIHIVLQGDTLDQALDDNLENASTVLKPTIRKTKATAPNGSLVNGELVSFGPCMFFKPDDATMPCTLASNQPNLQFPVLFDRLESEQQAALKKLFDGESVPAPLDPTGGKALAVIESKDTFLQHLQKGGIIIFPLLALGCIALVIVCIKSCQFLALEKKLVPLRQIAEDNTQLSKDELEEKLFQRATADYTRLGHFLPAIAVCASSAPLLGLLGTVTGMIHTFSLITIYGTGDASLLSSGISEALITTEVGLAIAIPAILAHAWLTRKLKRFQFKQQQLALELISQKAP